MAKGLDHIILDKVGTDQQCESPASKPCPLLHVVLHFPGHNEKAYAEKFHEYDHPFVLPCLDLAHGQQDDHQGDDFKEQSGIS